MATQRNGFVPVIRPAEQYIENLPVSLNSNQTLSTGDAVSIVNGLIVPCTAGQDPGLPGYGVVLAVYTTANRPLTQYQYKSLVSGSQGRADVMYDPNAEFVVRCETSVGQSVIGKNVIIDQSAPNLVLGRSGMDISLPASASVNDLFKVVRISEFEELSGKESGFSQTTGCGLVVRWNRHVLKASTANA